MEIENGTCMKIDFCSFKYIFLDLKYYSSRFGTFFTWCGGIIRIIQHYNTSDDRISYSELLYPYVVEYPYM